MIVKDEADTIARCLDSARPFVDEMIVLDTGSSDDTIAVARAHGAQVYELPWPGSFSVARNAALARCTGDWVLSLDADEELKPPTGKNLRVLVARDYPFPSFLGLRIESAKWEDGVIVWPAFHGARLFPRHPDVTWMRDFHEQIQYVPDPEAIHFVATDEVVIRHWGYLPEQWYKKGKSERNLGFLRVQVEREPEEAFHWHNLGRQYVTEQRFQEALEPLNNAILYARRTGQCRETWGAVSYLLATWACCMCGHYVRAIEYGEEGIKLHPNYPALWNGLGAAYADAGYLTAARHAITTALSFDGKATPYEEDVGATNWRALRNLAQVYLKDKEYVRAIECIERALTYEPDLLMLRTELATPLGAIGEVKLAREVLRDVLKREPAFGPAQRALGALDQVEQILKEDGIA